MQTLVLDPDIARAVLNPVEFPRRCVWMVTVKGEIIVNDLDDGWILICPPPGVESKAWARAIKGAVGNMQSHLESSLTTYYRFLEATDPRIPAQEERRPRPRAVPNVRHIHAHCPECGMHVVSKDHEPYCGSVCQEMVFRDRTRINFPIPPELLELRKKENEKKE